MYKKLLFSIFVFLSVFLGFSFKANAAMYDSYNKLLYYSLPYSASDTRSPGDASMTKQIDKSVFSSENYGVICIVGSSENSSWKYQVSMFAYSDKYISNINTYSCRVDSGLYWVHLCSRYGDNPNGIGAFYGTTSHTTYENLKSFLTSVYNNNLSGDTNYHPNVDSPLNDTNSVYQKEIGYLQNVAMHSRYNQTTKVLSDYFTYNAKTNTDFDITADNVRVSCYTKLHCYYFTDSFQWLSKKPGGETITPSYYYYGSENGASHKINTIASDIYNQHSAEWETAQKLNTALFAQPYRKIEYYLRIEVKQDDGSWKYSGWVKIADGNASLTEGDKMTTGTTPDGTTDENSGYGGGTDTNDDSGQGTTDSEADSSAVHLPDSQADVDAQVDSYDGGLKSFINGINGIKSSIGQIPQLIGEFFTFLPAQVVALIGVGFAVIIVLRIIGR